MSEQPDAQFSERIKELEAKVHSLEIEKRITRIHAMNAKFKDTEKSLDFLDGYGQGYEEALKNHSSINSTVPQTPKTNVAENIAKHSEAPKGTPVGPIDEDEEKGNYNGGSSDL